MTKSIGEQCLRELGNQLRDHPRSVRREHLGRARELLDEALAGGDLSTTPRGWAQQYIAGADLATVAAPGWLRFWRRRRIAIVAGFVIVLSALSMLQWWNSADPVSVQLAESGIGLGVGMPLSDPLLPEAGFEARLGSVVLVGYTIENTSWFDIEVLGDVNRYTLLNGSTPWELTTARFGPVLGSACESADGCPASFPFTISGGDRVHLVLEYEITRCEHGETRLSDLSFSPPIGDLEYRWLGRTDVMHAVDEVVASVPDWPPIVHFPGPEEDWCKNPVDGVE